MKKFLKYTGICAFVFALTAFILMLACPSIVFSNSGYTSQISGILGIFGGSLGTIDFGPFGTYSATVKATWSAVIAFVLLIVAMVILLAGFLLPLFKINALEKFAGVLNLVAVLCLVVAGIFLFIELPCFAGVNMDGKIAEGYHLGAGWIVAGILSIVGAVVAIVPTVFDFIGKGK